MKICCTGSVEEAHTALDLGASAIGLVSRMPSGPGPIEEALIAEIIAAVPETVDTFLLTCETAADAIIAQQRRTRARTLQLVDRVDDGVHAALRRELDGVRLVQVIHVIGESSVAEAVSIAPSVDALLLDSGNPSLAVKELGGTGRRHDWSVSRRIVEESPVPVYLAGGLNSSNVREAIETVRPFGVDVCSGVRTNGRLDRDKLTAFMNSVLET
ncbi:MAG TPA: phosphoribosylanthranilate isomerase [Gemmatimonadaceae bacterium]|nr:phosphoribosylanthranilate isomerase [Gemmatimonadaceae bacterium]